MILLSLLHHRLSLFCCFFNNAERDGNNSTRVAKAAGRDFILKGGDVRFDTETGGRSGLLSQRSASCHRYSVFIIPTLIPQPGRGGGRGMGGRQRKWRRVGCLVSACHILYRLYNSETRSNMCKPTVIMAETPIRWTVFQRLPSSHWIHSTSGKSTSN